MLRLQYYEETVEKLLRESKKMEGKWMSGFGTALDPLPAGVRARPDDDEPRLAFAKSLPASDPFRQFVEYQLTVARLNGRDTPERLKAVLASSRLLKHHRDEWRPPWTEEAARRVQEYHFHRGFVELIRISGKDFQEFGEALLQIALIRHLDFTSTAGVWGRLSQNPLLSKIRSISISYNGLKDEDLTMLSRSTIFTELRWLCLSNNDIGEKGIESMAANQNAFPRLEYVSFAGNDCDPVEQFSADGDLILDSWLPEAGKKLEQKYGRIEWLHLKTRRLTDLPPDRFSFPTGAADGHNGANWLTGHRKVGGLPNEDLLEAC
jgi:hypothetical protein